MSRQILLFARITGFILRGHVAIITKPSPPCVLTESTISGPSPDLSLQLRDKIWEWPGNEARPRAHNKASYVLWIYIKLTAAPRLESTKWSWKLFAQLWNKGQSTVSNLSQYLVVTQGGHFHYKTLGVVYNKWCFESYVLIGHRPNTSYTTLVSCSQTLAGRESLVNCPYLFHHPPQLGWAYGTPFVIKWDVLCSQQEVTVVMCFLCHAHWFIRAPAK